MRPSILTEDGRNVPALIVIGGFASDNVGSIKKVLAASGFEYFWPDDLPADSNYLKCNELHNWLRFLFDLEPKDKQVSLREVRLIGAVMELQRAAEAIKSVLKDYKKC